MKHISEYFEEALLPLLERAEQAKQALAEVAETSRDGVEPACAEPKGEQE